MPEALWREGAQGRVAGSRTLDGHLHLLAGWP